MAHCNCYKPRNVTNSQTFRYKMYVIETYCEICPECGHVSYGYNIKHFDETIKREDGFESRFDATTHAKNNC